MKIRLTFPMFSNDGFEISANVVKHLMCDCYASYMDINALPINVDIGEFTLIHINNVLFEQNISGKVLKNLYSASRFLEKEQNYSTGACSSSFFSHKLFKDLTGDMFGTDSFGLFRALYGVSPKEYRKNLLDAYIVDIRDGIDYCCSHGLADVKICNLPVSASSQFLGYTCTVKELKGIVEEEYKSGICQFNHFEMVHKNILAYVNFINMIK